MPSWGEVGSRIQKAHKRVGGDAYDIVRRHYLKKFAEERERDVILYSSGWTHQNIGDTKHSIRAIDVHGFMEALSGLDGEALDLIVHSPGGEPEATEHIVEYLRKMYPEISVFVPQAAKSASTLMCCAADEVWMGKHSSLGPIDPQIALQTDLGVRLVPANSIIDQFDDAKKEYEDKGQIGAWAPILTQYGPSLLRECEDAKNYSEDLAERWARKYMLDGDDAGEKAEALASHLVEREEHNSHHRPIMRHEARDIGFNVEELEQDQTIQDLVLSVFHAASHTHAGTLAAKIIENPYGDSYIQLGGGQRMVEGEDDDDEDSE